VPILYNQTTINGRLNVVVSNIDAGAGVGQMRILGTLGTVALIPLQKPSGTVSGGILTFSGLPLGSATLISDSVVGADIEDSTGLVVASGLTVGPSSAFDIIMPVTTVLTGQIISLVLATITGE
jgi:hypothetical protein